MIAENDLPDYPEDEVIKPAQVRAARALLNWRQRDLAEASGVSEIAIKKLEREISDPRTSTLAAIERAFNRAGVVFLDDGDVRSGGAGVRFESSGER